MYHIARINDGFPQPLGSAANEDTAKQMIKHYEVNPPEWIQQEDGTWKASVSPYRFYSVSDHTDWGNTFSGRK